MYGRAASSLYTLPFLSMITVAPAALAFAVGMRASLDVVVLLYFVACGISRLARFNATVDQLSDESGKVPYFEGTPIPTSIVLVLILGVAQYLGRVGDQLWFGVVRIGPAELHPLTLMFAGALNVAEGVETLTVGAAF